MRIGIDVREAYAPMKTGKGQWTFGVLEELKKREVDVCEIGSEFGSGWQWHWKVARKIPSMDLDVYLSPTSFIVPYLLKSDVPFVPVIHDLIAFQREPHDRKARILEQLLLPRILPKALRIIAISASTKNDLLARFPSLDPQSIHVVYAGPLKEAVPASMRDEKIILCAATLCPRKNQMRLIEAYRNLPENLRNQYALVLVGGRGWHDSEIVSLARKTEGVEWRGYVSEEEYRDLLSRATVFAYPSLYEGFGMPVLDALQRGIPVLTSDRGSLREISADAALICDPESVHSIQAGLFALLSDDHVRMTLAKKGPEKAKEFSWARTTDLLMEALQSV